MLPSLPGRLHQPRCPISATTRACPASPGATSVPLVAPTTAHVAEPVNVWAPAVPLSSREPGGRTGKLGLLSWPTHVPQQPSGQAAKQQHQGTALCCRKNGCVGRSCKCNPLLAELSLIRWLPILQLLGVLLQVRPAVNQVEVHPYFRNQALIDYCAKEGVHVTAYSSLGTPSSAGHLVKKSAPNPAHVSGSGVDCDLLLVSRWWAQAT